MHVTGKPAKENKPLRLTFTVIVENDGGSFHAYCPAFKGLHADGQDIEEALRNATQAAAAYVRSMAQHGEPLPLGPDCKIFEEEQIPRVPPGALLRHVELQWPLQNESGIS
jgi:predicted RNase H-like HicB family nuclease